LTGEAIATVRSALSNAALIGGGLIGAGWAARLIHNGVDVNIYDPDPQAPRRLANVLTNADRAFAKLTNAPQTRRGSVRFAASLAEAVEGADLIQESAPERLELKQRLLAEIDRAAASEALIGSSTSGLRPSELQCDMARPERFVVGHPFNPVYLLPLVEVVGGVSTAAATIERATTVYAALGMKPLVVRNEIDAFIGDRLTAAMWREALWLVHDDIATAGEIDDVIRHSFGLRFAQMGAFMIYGMAGGEGGMRHFLDQFGPSLKWPWTKLVNAPELDGEFLDKIAAQWEAEAGGRSVDELERIRDDNLVAILQALRAQQGGKGWGAGAVLKDHEERLYAAAHADAAAAPHDLTKPLQLFRTHVAPEWIDYNGHMTEARYLQVFSDSSDALLGLLGIDPAYHGRGLSYFTVETHIVHLKEVRAFEPIHTTAQVLGADDKRLHIFQTILHTPTGDILATGEQMLLHVDTRAQKACPAEPFIRRKLEQLSAAHAALPRPKCAGRAVGMKTA
jgi:carnitine 3-dehydrogenase